MTTVFPHVHTDDLDAVLDKKGQSVYPYSSVPLKSINHERVLARADAMTQESINRSRKHAETIGVGEEVS
jgi:hypothetical protein